MPLRYSFAASYQATARRRGKKIAAIARKLLTPACHLLTGAQITAPRRRPPRRPRRPRSPARRSALIPIV